MCSQIKWSFWEERIFAALPDFCNARQCLPKEPLEVYAAGMTRLVLEAFPNYGKQAIAMERF